MNVDRAEVARHPLPTLDASVTRRLHSVAIRLRRYVFVEGLAWVVVFVVAASLVQFLLDYAAKGLRWSMRAALCGVIVGALMWLVWRHIIRPLRRRVGLAEVACLVERRYPELSSILISAVRFSTGEVGPRRANSSDMMASVIDRASQQVRALDFNVVLDSRRARWSLVFLIAATTFFVGITTVAPDVTALWFARSVLLRDVAWPRRTHLVVAIDGRELLAARGDDVLIGARATGVEPREVQIAFETASGKRSRESMVTVGSPGSYRYRHTFKSAREDFTFHLEGGDDRTESYQARLVDRPHVSRSDIQVTPPTYTELDPFTLGNRQRAVQVLLGSRVAIRVETNKPIAHARLMAGDDAVAETDGEGTRRAATFVPDRTATYHFALLDEVGFRNRQPVRFSVRVVRDEPPQVRMRLPGVGDMITPEATLPIRANCSDAYGLAAVELVVQVLRERAPEQLIPLPGFSPRAKTFEASVSWPVSSEALTPGDRLTLFTRATDFDDVSGPNVAQTPDKTLRIVTRDELLAELARREQSSRIDFERLIDRQEQLRGELLTTLSQFGRSTTDEGLPGALAPLERKQRDVAASVNAIHRKFERVLSELRINQLDTADEVRRLSEGIVQPLTDLAKRDLVASADSIRGWARANSPEQASQVDPAQAAAVVRMRAVLSHMIQWEGYHEVLNMLRDIIRLQKDLSEEARRMMLDEASDVFDD